MGTNEAANLEEGFSQKNWTNFPKTIVVLDKTAHVSRAVIK
jgi:hypothetical protein